MNREAISPSDLVSLMHRLGDQSAEIILPFFRTDLAVDAKGNEVAPGIYICLMRFEPDDGEPEQQDFKLLVRSDFTGMVLTWR